MNEVHASHPGIAKRLKRASGHLNKVIAMIEERAPCLDVAQQLHAVANAVANARSAYVRDHIEHCIDGRHGDLGEVVGELKEISKYL
jgi:DNA-binding FrmR family transcriptional regulator